MAATGFDDGAPLWPGGFDFTERFIRSSSMLMSFSVNYKQSIIQSLSAAHSSKQFKHDTRALMYMFLESRAIQIDWLLTCPTYLNTLSPRRSCAATTVLRAADRTLLSRSLIWLAITFNAMAGDGWQTLSPQVDMRFPSSSRHSEPHKRTHIRTSHCNQ